MIIKFFIAFLVFLVPAASSHETDAINELNHMAQQLSKIGSDEEALALLQRALDLQPNYFETLLNLGNAYRTSAPDRARAYLNAAGQVISSSSRSDQTRQHLALGKALAQVLSFELAHHQLELAMLLAKSDGDSRRGAEIGIHQAAIFVQERRFLEAKESLELSKALISLGPEQSPETRKMINVWTQVVVEFELASGSLEIALAALATLTKEAEPVEQGYFAHRIGKILLDSGSVDDAEFYMEKAAELLQELLGEEHADTQAAVSDLRKLRHSKI